MKRRYKRSLALAMAAAMILAVPASSMADDSIVAIKREEVGQLALDYSPTVKGLELDRTHLSQDYLDLKEQMEGLEELYDQVSTYKSLSALYGSITTSPHYETYMGLMMLVTDPTDITDTNLLAALAMIDGVDEDPDDDDSDTILDENGIDNATEVLLADEVTNKMTIVQYGTYLGLKAAFTEIGIISGSDPNISKRDEYDTFIYPIKIAPAAMQNGATLMGVATDQAAAGIAAGAEGLYDAILMLDGFMELQTLSNEMAQDTLTATTKRYEAGLVSETDYKKAVNDAKIAALNVATMSRDVANLKMQLNAMLGQDVMTTLVLDESAGDTVVLESVDFYINRGQTNRAEIRNNRSNTSNKEDEMELVEKYLGTRAIEYSRAEGRLKDLALEKQYALKDIEADVRKAYATVLEKEEAYRISSLKMADAIRQQKDIQVNVELGYVTANTAKGLDVLVASATNEYYKAYRDYRAAIATLELESTIGQMSMGGF